MTSINDATLPTPGCAATAGAIAVAVAMPAVVRAGLMTAGGGIIDDAADREGIVTTAVV